MKQQYIRIATVIFCHMAVATAFAHVFDDAVYLFRGGKDRNGNGTFEYQELRNTMDANATTTAAPGMGNFLRFTNEDVHCPYSGRLIQGGCIYLPQEFNCTTNTSGGDVTVTADGRIARIAISDVFKDVDGECPNWSTVIRFRREAAPKPATSLRDILLSIGYSWNNHSGLLLSFVGDNMTNRWFRIYAGADQSFAKDQDGWRSTSWTNSWTDVGISVEGWKMTVWYVQENGPLMKAEKTYEYNASTITQLAAKPDWNVVIGLENSGDIWGGGSPYCKVVNGVVNSAQPCCNCFRGSIQQFGFWTRALSEAEILEAMGAPAPALLRVGLANGTSAEFAATATSVGTANWEDLNPSLSAGGSLSVAFTNDAVACALPQVLTLVPTPSSGSGSVAVSLNGVPVQSVLMASGRICDIAIATNFFRSGANTLTLTRTDSGATPVTFDTFYLAGSWIAGNPGVKFPKSEWEANNTRTLYAGGDWHWKCAAMTPSANANSHVFYVPIEKRLIDKGYVFRYSHNVLQYGGGSGMTADVYLNEVKIVEGMAIKAGTVTCDLPSNVVVDGTNKIEVRYAGGDGWANFSWHAVDYKPLRGMILIFR